MSIIAACKVVDSELQLLDSRLLVRGTCGFRIPIVSGIPDSLSSITYPKAQDSRFHKKIKISDEEAIKSTEKRISSLKVFHVLLYRRSSVFQDIYFLYRIRRFVFELSEDACINTRKSREITSLPKSKNLMNMARHLNHHRK